MSVAKLFSTLFAPPVACGDLCRSVNDEVAAMRLNNDFHRLAGIRPQSFGDDRPSRDG